MWQKIKKWFGFLDLNEDGKVTTADLEVAKTIANKNAKAANEAINEVAEAAVAVKKVVKGVKGRKKK